LIDCQTSTEEIEEETADDDEPTEGDDVTAARLSDYDYLVTMQLIKLSEEEKDKLLRERDEKKAELTTLQGKSELDLWTADLDAFLVVLEVRVFPDGPGILWPGVTRFGTPCMSRLE